MKFVPPMKPNLVLSATLLAAGLGLGLSQIWAAPSGSTNASTAGSTSAPAGKSKFLIDSVGTNGPSTNAPVVVDADAASAELSKSADEFIAKGNYPEAILALEKAAKLTPDNEELHFNLAFALNRVGRIRESIAEYRETLRVLPEYAEAHNNLGNLLMKTGDLGEAVKQFELAIKHQPENSNAHNNLGTALARLGKLSDAVVHFQDAIRLRPDYAEAWMNVGTARLGQNRYQEAAEALDNALRLNPRLEPARKAMARLRERVAAAAAAAKAAPGEPAATSK